MKHAQSRYALGFPVLAALILLAACGGRIGQDDILLPSRAAHAEDWSRFLPTLYPGLSACLATYPAQPAYATEVTPQNRGMLLVRMTGTNGAHYECSVGTGGNPAPQLTPTDAQPPRGPLFTPSAMAEPFLRCGTPEPVLTRTGKLLGWLTYLKADCPPAKAPAVQESWRAAGNEPFWSLHIRPDGLLFDRLGELPLAYPAQAPVQDGNQRRWVVDATDGEARNRLEIVISDGPCGDSMADRRYDYRAEMIFRGQSLRGCAEKDMPIPR